MPGCRRPGKAGNGNPSPLDEALQVRDRDELDEYLDDARSRGHIDSEGRFTLNLQKAREKLGRFQLPEPRAYILKLVQWAIASGASEVRVEVTRRTVSVAHDGLSLPLDALEHALVSPLSGEGREFLHLSVGLAVALTFEPERVVLQSEGKQWQLLPFVDGPQASPDGMTRLRLEGLRPARPLEGSRLVRQFLGGNWNRVDIEGPLQKLLWDGIGFSCPEAALVRQLCHYASVPLYLNGRPINRPVLGLPARYHQASGFLDVWPAAGRPCHSKTRFLISQTPGQGALAAPTSTFFEGHCEWIGLGRLGREGQVVAQSPTPAVPRLAAGVRDFIRQASFGQAFKPVLGSVFPDHATLATRLGRLLVRGHPMVASYAEMYRSPEQQGSRLFWVYDGVVVQESRQMLQAPVTAVVDASHLGLDLSFFGMNRRDEAFLDTIRWLDFWAP